ncbi:hypothetical protein D3C80_2216070 [compost metagenome]
MQARLRLVGLGNGILEIDDHSIGTTGQSLSETFRPVARYKQRRAHQVHVLIHDDCLQ